MGQETLSKSTELFQFHQKDGNNNSTNFTGHSLRMKQNDSRPQYKKFLKKRPQHRHHSTEPSISMLPINNTVNVRKMDAKSESLGL